MKTSELGPVGDCDFVENLFFSPFSQSQDTQHNDIQNNSTHQIDIQHNHTQHKDSIRTLGIKTLTIMGLFAKPSTQTLSIMDLFVSLSTKTLSIVGLFATLSITVLSAECRVFLSLC